MKFRRGLGPSQWHVVGVPGHLLVLRCRRRRPRVPVPGLRLRRRHHPAAVRAAPPRARHGPRGVRAAGGAGQRRRCTNIQARIATNRMTVTARFATVSTATSTPRWLLPAACTSQSAPLVTASPIAEDQQPLRLVTQRVPATAHPEGEPPVGRGVPDRGEQQRQRVGGPGAGPAAEQQVEGGVGHGRRDPDQPEHRHLHPEPPGAGVRRRAAEPLGDVGEREPAGEQVAAEPEDAADVVVRRPQRCRPGCPSRRPSPPAPRGSAARPARRAPAARCRRTTRRPRPAAAPRAPRPAGSP